MILDILKKHWEVFHISEIYHIEMLEQCHRTSFAWSEFPKSLCLATDRAYFRQAIENKNIAGIIAPPAAIEESNLTKAIIVSERANELFYFLHNMAIHKINPPPTAPEYEFGIDPTAMISPRAIVAEQVSIGPNVVINDGCIVLDNTFIGADSVLYHYATIGTQGFFSKKILEKKTHVVHYGGVRIGQNCIIHAGTNISRSVNVNEFTSLGDGVHVGIHTNIGHDCNIGDNCDLSAKVFLAGRVKMGQNCWVGASAVISNSVNIGDNANIKIGSVVIEDVPSGKMVSGHFARSHMKNLREFLRSKE
jgi:UDP-3-O-[3-hydroxymyristoyl] glucosamine N-acyltransferase